jgi:hypothetical protein
MAGVAEATMTKEDALMVISVCLFNQLPRARLRFDVPGIKDSYDLASRIDAVMREKYGDNCHRLRDMAELTLKG